MTNTDVFVKPTMAFIDCGFHRKTKSGDFLRELFSQWFVVTNYWDDSSTGGARVQVSEINKYDYVFYFQILNPLRELRKVTARIIWAPMYDGLVHDSWYWKSLTRIPMKVLAFSQKVQDICDQYRMEHLSVRYFIDPQRYVSALPRNGVHIFFWYRGAIGFSDIQRIVNPDLIDSLTYYISTPDPGYTHEDISDDDQRRFHMKIIRQPFVLHHEDFLSFLDNTNVFIAPRKKEGIGTIMLEALAMGKCLIGYDDATMNEYIQDGINGFLFDEHSGRVMELRNVKNMLPNCNRMAYEGYEQWKSASLRIGDFIVQSFVLRSYTKRPWNILVSTACESIFLTKSNIRIIRNAAYSFLCSLKQKIFR